MKKITSMFMAVAMILALAVPALAASTASASITGSAVAGATVSPDNPYKSDFKGEYQETIINVSIPNNVALVFNPYRLQYKASTNHTGDNNAYLVDQLADQIFSAPVTIISKSNIALKVDMKFDVEQTGDLELVNDESEFDHESKKACLQMEYGIVTNADDTPADSADKKVVTLTAGEEIALTSLLEDEAAAAALMLEIPPCVDADHPSYFCYKFTGEAEIDTGTEEPRPYNDQDGINVGITFTFLPVANDANQVQGGTFTYTTSATPATNTDSADIVVDLIKAVSAKDSNGTRTYTLPAELKYGDTPTNGVTVSDDGNKLTIKKELVVTKATANATAGTKYVVVIPVKFTVTDGVSSNPKTDTVDCNVRIIMNPKAAS